METIASLMNSVIISVPPIFCLCCCKVAVNKIKNLTSEETWQWKQTWVEDLAQFKLTGEELSICE
jgi:outer membrane biogenesis lipoprotein LolB